MAMVRVAKIRKIILNSFRLRLLEGKRKIAARKVIIMVTKAAFVEVRIIATPQSKREVILKFLLNLPHERFGLKTSLIRKIKAKVAAETIWGMCLKTPINLPPLKKKGKKKGSKIREKRTKPTDKFRIQKTAFSTGKIFGIITEYNRIKIRAIK